MEALIITERNFFTLLEKISSDRELFVPTDEKGRIMYRKWREVDNSSVYYPETRIGTPVKAFFFPPKETVSSFPSDRNRPRSSKKAIFGLKSCDLAALNVLDTVFLDEEVVDPYYATRRLNTLLISSDCPQISDTCFCNKVGGGPFPREGFDLNVTKLSHLDDLIVEVNPDSPRAKEVYEKNSELFQQAPKEVLEERASFRTSTLEKLEQNNSFFHVPEDVADIPVDHPIWHKSAEECVECGACNLVCPTCHCFQLYETSENSTATRKKVWDTCSFKGYSRVAGGANPLRSLESRVRNRFYDKFGRIYKNLELYGCTGCGRCIDSCMGDIDMRDILKEIAVEINN